MEVEKGKGAGEVPMLIFIQGNKQKGQLIKPILLLSSLIDVSLGLVSV